MVNHFSWGKLVSRRNRGSFSDAVYALGKISGPVTTQNFGVSIGKFGFEITPVMQTQG